MNTKNKNQNLKLVIYYILIFVFIVLSALFLKKSFKIQDAYNITYKENSNVNYKVLLKPNEFYDTPYLSKDMVYVANLIDKISIDFNYLFNIDEKTNIDFEYNIIGKLTISDKTNKNNFFEKEYVLLENKKDQMNSNGEHVINESVDIDYDYYNTLANKFRNNYGLDTVSNLIVYFNIHEKSNKDLDINNDSVSSITIPLSEKAINITMNYQEVNKINKIIRDKAVVINNKMYIGFGVSSLLMGIIFIILYIDVLLSTVRKKSKYDKYLKRILREYDRLIVETTTKPETKKLKTIDIKKFEELLDVRDNLKLPIKYYIVKEHKECNFYINHENELYLFVLKDEEKKEVKEKRS